MPTYSPAPPLFDRNASRAAGSRVDRDEPERSRSGLPSAAVPDVREGSVATRGSGRLAPRAFASISPSRHCRVMPRSYAVAVRGHRSSVPPSIARKG
jgi:hypothetical protein